MKEIFSDIKNLVAEKSYKSKFDFEKYGISEKDKSFIIQREEIIIENTKKHAQSLYEICKAIYEIRLALKGDESQSFREWYTLNGLTKDKVSELTKRYELYIQASDDKKDFITRLSIPAVKELTKKNIDPDIQIEAIEKGLNNIEEIKEFISTKVPTITNDKSQVKKRPKHIQNFINFYEKNIKKDGDLKELARYKKELHDFEAYIKALQYQIDNIENTRKNENNLKLYDIKSEEIEEVEIVPEKNLWMSEEHKFYTIQKTQNGEYIIVELENETDQKGKQVGRNYWYSEGTAIKALERKAQLNNWIAV